MVSDGADHETTGDPRQAADQAPTTAPDPKTAAAVAAAEAAAPPPGTSVRVDTWIWSVRLVKTRSQGATACRGGHVRINGERVKPAHSVRVGDEVRVRQDGRERIVVVTRLIRKRVGAPVAAQCYVDNSPPPPPRAAVAPVAIRDRGAGRPTKRDRRELDRLRGLSDFDPLTPPPPFDDPAIFDPPTASDSTPERNEPTDSTARGTASDRDCTSGGTGGKGATRREGSAGRGRADRRGGDDPGSGSARRGGSRRRGGEGRRDRSGE
ncbi:RNA-binding S4 domain-containing protein [Streptomyces sp. bgisy154]|uniref:RNA-binding S4 domain-containing protein n=1 Tax=Streptomyces sp. bgisy154 TaxID=3413794 RepID=UPI003D75AD22